MPRTIVDIPATQIRDLDARCAALGVSRAEGVRRAIRAFLDVGSALNPDAFGLWTRSDAKASRRVPAENRDEVA